MAVPMVKEIDYNSEARRFTTIQFSRYLEDRQGRGFSSPAEHDAVLAMIKDAWVELRCSGGLDSLSEGGREAVYWTTLIVFPTFVADTGLECIPVDFVGGKRIGEQVLALSLAPKRPVLNPS